MLLYRLQRNINKNIIYIYIYVLTYLIHSFIFIIYQLLLFVSKLKHQIYK